MEDELDGELRSPFPSPPSHYTKYTTHNLELLSLLKQRTSESADSELDQQQVLSDQPDVPEWPLMQLEKPRVDWILEEGHYTIFGDVWNLKETVPSLESLGGRQLYPSDPDIDRRPALLSILRSSLVTYSSLLRSLLAPPAPEPHHPEWEREVEWITVLTQNMMAAANDLRPVQARANLEQMMTRQLELRREETKKIHEKCDALEARLADLRFATRQSASGMDSRTVVGESVGLRPSQEPSQRPPALLGVDIKALTSEDLLRWAEA